MLAYRTVITMMIAGLCVSYSMTIHSMEEDVERQLVNPVSARSRSSSSSWSSVLPQSARQSLFSNSSSIKTPMATRPSGVATVPSTYSKKKIAAIGSLVVAAGFAGYYIGSTCQMCVHELNAAQSYVTELDNSFRACQNSTDHFASLLDTCVDSLDSVRDLILEVCTIHK